MPDLNAIVDELSGLTVLEAAELSKLLGCAGGNEHLTKPEIVPSQAHLFNIWPHLLDGQLIASELLILIRIGLGRESCRGLVIVNLEKPASLIHQAVDFPPEPVEAGPVEVNVDPILQPNGLSVRERMMLPVIIP